VLLQQRCGSALLLLGYCCSAAVVACCCGAAGVVPRCGSAAGRLHCTDAVESGCTAPPAAVLRCRNACRGRAPSAAVVPRGQLVGRGQGPCERARCCQGGVKCGECVLPVERDMRLSTGVLHQVATGVQLAMVVIVGCTFLPLISLRGGCHPISADAATFLQGWNGLHVQ
jgi:hypothetical protein